MEITNLPSKKNILIVINITPLFVFLIFTSSFEISLFNYICGLGSFIANDRYWSSKLAMLKWEFTWAWRIEEELILGSQAV